MPNLVKFCKPQHNVLESCHTIRFGTFEYYRKMHPSSALADATEGIETVDINSIDLTTASPEAKAAVSPMTGPQSHIQLINLRLNVTFPNCYIWCCSQVPDPIPDDFGSKFDPDYSSYYKIRDLTRFNEHLLSLVTTNITRTSFSDAAREKLDNLSIGELREIVVAFVHRPVVYVDEKLSTIDEGELSPYVRDIPQQLRPIFVKPTKYADDREYRFVFSIEHRRHGVFAVKEEPVDIPVIPIEGI